MNPYSNIFGREANSRRQSEMLIDPLKSNFF